MMTLLDAIQFKYPDADPFFDYQVCDKGDGVLYIGAWNLPDPMPTEQDIQAWQLQYALQYKQKEAIDKRIYPSCEQQLDMMYQDKIDGTTVWLDTITAIKKANPKPTE